MNKFAATLKDLSRGFNFIRRATLSKQDGRQVRVDMVIVMDMSTGHRLDDFGDFADEVLGANWTPTAEVVAVQPIAPARQSPAVPPITDIDAFLRDMYCYQE